MDLGINQRLSEANAARLSREWEVQTAVTSTAATPQEFECVWPTVKLLVLAGADMYYNFGVTNIAGGGDVDTTNDMKIMADIPTLIDIPWGAINLDNYPHLEVDGRGTQSKLYFIFECTAGSCNVRVVKQ